MAKRLGMLMRHALLVLGAGMMLAPFVLMISISLKPPGEVFAPHFTLFPDQWHAVENYTAAFTRVPLARFILNGLMVTACIFAMQALTALPMAYALAKLAFKGRSLLLLAVLGAFSIPIQVTALPLYIGLSWAQLLNTYFAQMLPFFLSLFAIFLLRQHFKSFPDEIIEAARMDGMREFEIVWRIVVPSARPAIAAFAIFSIVAHWNDLYWPMIVITQTEMAPPPLGMLLFASAESGANYGALMAGATLITAPLVLAFLVARRRFIQGITLTGLK